MDGILIVDKPQGLTSHDIVSFIRKRFDLKKVGHSGTLDPLASGILVILLGKATKLFSKFSGQSKGYEVKLTLGITTDSADSQGRILSRKDASGLSREKVEETFEGFKGTLKQTPPMFSALKYKGSPLYKLARKGISVPRKRREVTIHQLEINDIYLPEVSFNITCSKGTYIRSLCEEIGQRLGCGAHMSYLRRVKSGPFQIDKAVSLDTLKKTSPDGLGQILINMEGLS